MTTVGAKVTTTAKVVPVTTPAAVSVVATQVNTPADHPAVTVSVTGAMQVQTVSGVQFAKPGDYVLPDGNGGFKVVPLAFYQLQYKVVG
jgi:hypothetical protein